MSTSIVARPVNHGQRARFPSGLFEHLDVLIVGAGLSGIGAACHLRAKTARQDLRDPRGARRHRRHVGPVPYPGIRPTPTCSRWATPSGRGRTRGDRRRTHRSCGTCASGARPRRRGQDPLSPPRRARRMVHAERGGRLDAERTDTGEAVRLTCGFLFTCTGYYRYDEGFTPHFEGRETSPAASSTAALARGPRLRRQARGVIGGGATAVTLVPAMAEQAAHVTMLQRSPSYVVSLPARDPVADALAARYRRRSPTRSCGGRRAADDRLLPAQPARPAPDQGLIRKGVERRLPRDYAWTPISSRAMTRGTSALPGARRRPVPGASARDTSSSRTASRPSPRRA